MKVRSGSELIVAVSDHHPTLYEEAKQAWLAGRFSTRVLALARLTDFRNAKDEEHPGDYVEALWLWI